MNTGASLCGLLVVIIVTVVACDYRLAIGSLGGFGALGTILLVFYDPARAAKQRYEFEVGPVLPVQLGTGGPNGSLGGGAGAAVGSRAVSSGRPSPPLVTAMHASGRNGNGGYSYGGLTSAEIIGAGRMSSTELGAMPQRPWSLGPNAASRSGFAPVARHGRM